MKTDKKRVVYLAGPIQDCSDDQCIDWRDEIVAKLPDFECRNPMVRDARGMEMTQETIKWVVEGDKQDIRESDIVIVNYMFPSSGTSMEILQAYNQFTPVLVICDKPINEISPWIQYHSTRIFQNIDEVVEYLKLDHDNAHV